MSRRIALGILVAVVGGLVLLASASIGWTNFSLGFFDPDSEFFVDIVNPCATDIEFHVHAEPESGSTGRSRAITVQAESIVTVAWEPFDGDLVVSAPSLAWERQIAALERYQQADILLAASDCP